MGLSRPFSGRASPVAGGAGRLAGNAEGLVPVRDDPGGPGRPAGWCRPWPGLPAGSGCSIAARRSRWSGGMVIPRRLRVTMQQRRRGDSSLDWRQGFAVDPQRLIDPRLPRSAA